MANKLVHFEVPAKDSKRAMNFYKGVFGWQFSDSGMPNVDYNLTEAGSEPGGAVYTAEEGQTGVLVYFDTDDIDASIAEVRESGGEAEDKGPIPGVGWYSHCKDTEGNAFGLFKGDESAPPPG